MRRTGFVLPLEHPSGTKYVHSPQLQRFLDKNDKSPIRLFQCFCFPDLQEVVNSYVETDGSHSALGWVLAARSTRSFVSGPSVINPGRSKSPLLLSAKFSAQSELNDFFDFFRLAVADKNGHDPSIFAKVFEPILRHVLRAKMTPLYLEICFVTSYSRMTGLVNE